MKRFIKSITLIALLSLVSPISLYSYNNSWSAHEDITKPDNPPCKSKCCDKNSFKECIMEFVGSRGVNDRYPYYFLFNNCRTTSSSIVESCRKKTRCY